MTALHIAADHGNTEIVALLLNSGADINAKTKYNRTVFEYAASNGHVKIMKLLVNKGATINTNTAYSALRLATENGRYDAVFYLSNAYNFGDQEDPLIRIAAANGFYDIVKLFISMGVDVNAKDAINRTPLIYAAYKGRFDVVKLLIANGALINEKEKSNYTALHCASEYNDLKINGSLPDEDVYLKIVALLLNSGADINATQFAGRTPLILAAKDGLLKIVKTLVDRGALINLKDTTGSGHGSALNATALFYAIDRNHLDLAKFLIENGADVTAKANGSINKNNPLEQLNAAQHPLFCNSLLPLKTAEQAGAKSEESIKAHKQECALLQLAFEAALPESPCTFASLKSHAQEAIQKLKPALPNRYKTVADAFARFYLLPARFPEMYKLLQEEEILCKTLCTHLPFKLGRHRFYKQFYNSKSTNFCMVPYTFGNLKRLLPLLKNQKQPSSICKPDMLITFSKPRGSKRKKESHLETTDNWSYIFPQSHQYEAINDKFYICMSHLNHQN